MAKKWPALQGSFEMLAQSACTDIDFSLSDFYFKGV